MQATIFSGGPSLEPPNSMEFRPKLAIQQRCANVNQEQKRNNNKKNDDIAAVATVTVYTFTKSNAE